MSIEVALAFISSTIRQHVAGRQIAVVPES
jgi:hypothetical protein